MPIKDLYIIGNGFDLHHHMPCSFSDFHSWLETNKHNETLNAIDNLYNANSAWWSDFEHRLGEPDIVDNAQQKFNECLDDFVKNDKDFSSARDMSKVAYEAEEEVSNMKSLLDESLRAWIKSLATPNQSCKIPLERGGFFINFNYTDTLERLCNIPSEQIWHIHGFLRNNEEQLIVGHANLEGEIAGYSGKSDNLLVETAIGAYAQAVYGLRKPVDEIIVRNSRFWKTLSSVEHIHIYGYSFSDIDEPYLNKIIDSVKDRQSITWDISYYTSKDISNILCFISRYNIPCKHVQLRTLLEIQNASQLSLNL